MVCVDAATARARSLTRTVFSEEEKIFHSLNDAPQSTICLVYYKWYILPVHVPPARARAHWYLDNILAVCCTPIWLLFCLRAILLPSRSWVCVDAATARARSLTRTVFSEEEKIFHSLNGAPQSTICLLYYKWYILPVHVPPARAHYLDNILAVCCAPIWLLFCLRVILLPSRILVCVDAATARARSLTRTVFSKEQKNHP